MTYPKARITRTRSRSRNMRKKHLVKTKKIKTKKTHSRKYRGGMSPEEAERKANENMNIFRLNQALQQSIRANEAANEALVRTTDHIQEALDNEAANEKKIQSQEMEKTIALQQENVAASATAKEMQDRKNRGFPEIRFDNVDIAMTHEKERQRIIGEKARHFNLKTRRYHTEQEWEDGWNERIESHKALRSLIKQTYDDGIKNKVWRGRIRREMGKRWTFKDVFSKVRHGITEDQEWGGYNGGIVDREDGVLDEILNNLGDREIFFIETEDGEYSIYVDKNTGCYLYFDRGDDWSIIENIWGIFGPGGVIEKSGGEAQLRSIDAVIANPPPEYKYL